MRGKLDVRRGIRSLHGITPACAGKTLHELERAMSYDGARDHPRVCGENDLKQLLKMQKQDHPRVCGENFRLPEFSLPVLGSPPRVRGKQTPIASATSFWGITPACAGKT